MTTHESHMTAFLVGALAMLGVVLAFERPNETKLNRCGSVTRKFNALRDVTRKTINFDPYLEEPQNLSPDLRSSEQALDALLTKLEQ